MEAQGRRGKQDGYGTAAMRQLHIRAQRKCLVLPRDAPSTETKNGPMPPLGENGAPRNGDTSSTA